MRLLFIAVVTLGVSACDVGTYLGPSGGPDGGTGGTVDSPGNQLACEPTSNNKPDGHHREGEGCMNAGGCHGSNPGGPPFKIAGTLYTTQAGTTAAPGATIIVGTQKMIVGDGGNFYSNAAVTFPIKTSASLCPDNKPMIGPLNSAADGNCNACHNGTVTAKLYLK